MTVYSDPPVPTIDSTITIRADGLPPYQYVTVFLKGPNGADEGYRTSQTDATGYMVGVPFGGFNQIGMHTVTIISTDSSGRQEVLDTGTFEMTPNVAAYPDRY